MTECRNEMLRDRLPLLLRGTLPAAEATVLRAHVTGCAACTAELRVLEAAARLFDAATPTVDTAAILAKLPAAPGRPALRVVHGGGERRTWRVSRSLVAAAASVLFVASLSLVAVQQGIFGNGGGDPRTPDTGADSLHPTTSVTPPALVAGADLGDLGTEDLEVLLTELEQMEATVAADPVSMQRAVANVPEGL